MNQKNAEKHDATFKAEVLKMVNSGQSVPHAAKALGVFENLINSLKSKNNMEKERLVHLRDLSSENQQLRNQVRQLEAERDILRKS